MCAARLGVFKFLEHEAGGSLAHDESVAAGAEGARGVLGVVVAGGEGVHGGESAHAGGPDGGFGAAGDDGVGLAQTNEVEGVGQGVGGGGAGRGGGVVRTVEAEGDGYLSGSDVGDHLGDEEGVVFGAHFGAVHGIVAGFFLKGVYAADAHAEHHADAVFVDGFEVHAAVLDGFHGGYEGVLLVEVHFAGLLAVYVVGRLKAFHLAGKLCLELGGIEMGDGAGTADAFLKVFPRFEGGVAQGGEGAEACHYHSF